MTPAQLTELLDAIVAEPELYPRQQKARTARLTIMREYVEQEERLTAALRHSPSPREPLPSPRSQPTGA